MTEINHKFEKLTAALGVINDWRPTGWSCNNQSRVWACKWKVPVFTLKDLGELPAVQTHCHCSTKIKVNCLIINKNTRELAFVGSDCFKHFGLNRKPCFDCLETNSLRTKRCGACREKCDLHNAYHDDNATHKNPISEVLARQASIIQEFSDDETDDEGEGEEESFIDERFDLKGQEWDTHLISLYSGSGITESDKRHFREMLLHIRVPRGMHYGMTFGELATNHRDYYRWVKRVWSDDFIKYLP
jgi:hypothetical protein